ncbi:hypothetical protein LTS09_014013 [Friedmanniomyces endolithicus]|nr:hypothetical protein LTS09_014013 [Friedmanniomyces endolithicus]
MTRSQAIAEVGFKRVLIATEDIMDMEVESTSPAVCKIARSIKTCPRNTALLFMGANQPNANASVVATMRMGGALILGETTTTECTALESGPDSTNPHDLDCLPGGSSAGSAAAAAGSQVPLGFGIQTGGSVIRPASHTGTYAMKPTFNTIAGERIKVTSIEFDTIGYFARCMGDLQLEAREGFVKSPFGYSAGLGTIAVMEEAVETLRKHGVAVQDVDLAYESNEAAELTDIYKVIFVTASGACFRKDYFMDTTKIKLFPVVRAFIDDAPEYLRKQVRQAFEYYAALRPALDEIATMYPALTTPSAIDEASLGIGDVGSPIFNSVWTGARMPVIQWDQYLLSIATVLAEPLVKEGGWQKKLVYD